MLCLSLEDQSPADVAHALCMVKEQGSDSSTKTYNLYFTCHGVHRGDTAPRDKLQVSNATSVGVELPWASDQRRAFTQWDSPQWEPCSDGLLAPLTILPVHEKVFSLARGVEIRIVAQGEEGNATTNIVLAYAGEDCLRANFTRYL